MEIKNCMLAGTCEDVKEVPFPVLVTPKLDGFRVLTRPTVEAGKKCRVITRAMDKTIVNNFTREWMEENLPPELDGELLTIGADGKAEEFHTVSGKLRKMDGEPNFQFHVFDVVSEEPYVQRMSILEKTRLPRGRCRKVLPLGINCEEALIDQYHHYLKQGHEGLMMRTIGGPYKQGRSTSKEWFLMKLKPVVHEEAWAVGVVEGETNGNKNALKKYGLEKGATVTGHVGAVILKPAHLGRPTGEDCRFIADNKDRMNAALNNHPYLYRASYSIIEAVEGPCPMEDAPERILSKLARIKHWDVRKEGVPWRRPRFGQLEAWRDPEEVGL